MPVTPPRPQLPSTSSVEEKLDIIAEHLRRMDQRDKLRLWGGTVRSLIAIVPVLVFLWSIWYFANNADEIMKKIADEAASSAAKYSQQQGQGVLDELMKKYNTR
jgi:hypothetical protein